MLSSVNNSGSETRIDSPEIIGPTQIDEIRGAGEIRGRHILIW